MHGLGPVVLDHWFSNLEVHHHHLGSFFKCRCMSPSPRISVDAAGLKWGLRTCISDKLVGDAVDHNGSSGLILLTGGIFESSWLGPQIRPPQFNN